MLSMIHLRIYQYCNHVLLHLEPYSSKEVRHYSCFHRQLMCRQPALFLGSRWSDWSFIVHRFDVRVVLRQFKLLPRITVTCVKIGGYFFWFTEYRNYCSVKFSTTWCRIGQLNFVPIVKALRFWRSTFRQWISLYNSPFQELLANLISRFFLISGPYFMIKIKQARTEHEPNLQILLHYKQEAQHK